MVALRNAAPGESCYNLARYAATEAHLNKLRGVELGSA